MPNHPHEPLIPCLSLSALFSLFSSRELPPSLPPSHPTTQQYTQNPPVDEFQAALERAAAGKITTAGDRYDWRKRSGRSYFERLERQDGEQGWGRSLVDEAGAVGRCNGPTGTAVEYGLLHGHVASRERITTAESANSPTLGSAAMTGGDVTLVAGPTANAAVLVVMDTPTPGAAVPPTTGIATDAKTISPAIAVAVTPTPTTTPTASPSSSFAETPASTPTILTPPSTPSPSDPSPQTPTGPSRLISLPLPDNQDDTLLKPRAASTPLPNAYENYPTPSTPSPRFSDSPIAPNGPDPFYSAHSPFSPAPSPLDASFLPTQTFLLTETYARTSAPAPSTLLGQTPLQGEECALSTGSRVSPLTVRRRRFSGESRVEGVDGWDVGREDVGL